MRVAYENLVKRFVEEALERSTETLKPSDNLISAGLSSLDIMRIAGLLTKHGYSVTFAELIQDPCIASWTKLIEESESLKSSDCNPRSSKAPSIEGALFPISSVQHAYMVGRRDGQELGGTACHAYMEFECESLDITRLEKAVSLLLLRHPMLRARFFDDGTACIGEATQKTITIYRIEKAADQDSAIEAIRQKLSHLRFDIERDDLIDIRLTIASPKRTIMHVNVDLLAADVLSIQILLEDLAYLYRGVDLAPIGTNFMEYARATRTEEDVKERDKEYWLHRIDDMPGGPSLPTKESVGNVKKALFTRLEHLVDSSSWLSFTEKGRQIGITQSMGIAAVYAKALSRWSENKRFLLNLPLFDRKPVHPGIDKVVSDFTSLILLEADCTNVSSLLELSKQLQKRFQQDVAHSSFDAVKVLRELSRRYPNDAKKAPIVFASNIGRQFISEEVEAVFGPLSKMLAETPQVLLDHQIYDHKDGLLLAWDYVSDLLDDAMVRQLFDAYCAMVHFYCEHDWSEPFPDLLPPSQRAARREANSQRADLGGGTLHRRFFALAQADPGAPALRWGGDGEATYGELAERSLRIAGGLAAAGVGEGDRVAIRLPKGPGQVAAVLGVLAAGAAYVPIGVSQPEARAALILEQAGACACIDSPELSRLEAADPLAAPADPPDRALAYVIYTSGSTGVPKGVAVSHAAAWNTIADVVRRWGMGPGDAVLGVSALDFDLSVFDIFGALSFGAAVVLPSEEERRDASAWRDLVSSRGVTVWNSAPALLDVMLDDGPGAADGLRLALVSGDWVPLGLRSKLPEDVRLVAMGGATEAGIWSNYFEVGEVDPSWSSIPYGRPLSNQSFRVVGEDGLDCPDWVPGELWTGGGSLADGYLGDPSKTAASFVEDGGRWYRTGDMGRYWPGAVIEFLGRKDAQQQVKIRGHRVELGEVEAAVAACPGVKGAVAVVAGDRGRSAVHAFAIGDEGCDVNPARVLSRVAELLPSYFVPQDVTILAEWPLSANGKVDRKALADMVPETAPRASSFSEPATETERAVASVWEELLDVRPVGRESNFFELGGDSLMASRVIGRVRALGYETARLQLLFDADNLEEFCGALKKSAPAKQGASIDTNPSEEYESFPLTEIQHAYLVSRRDSSGQATVGTTYCQIFATDWVDIDRLDAAWIKVQKRHGMMRASIKENGTQVIAPPSVLGRFERIECTNSSEAKQILNTIKHTVFSLSKPPLHRVFAVSWLEESERRVRLAFCFDYTVLDALSITIVLSELAELYKDPEANLPDIGLTFRDFVIGYQKDNRDVETAKSYWRSRLSELPPAPQLPLAADPSMVGEGRFERLWRTIPESEWSKIKEKARLHGVTPSAALLACYARTLSSWSGGGGVTLNLTIFDRPEVHPDIDKVVGDFTTLLPVACLPSAGASIENQVRDVQKELASDLEHRAVSAVWVQRELARLAGTSGVVLPVVFTSALGLSRFDLDGDFMEYLGGLSQTPQVWLDHQAMERGGGVMLSWDYVSELFPSGMIADMFDAYCSTVSSLAAFDWSEPFPDLLPPSQRAARREANSQRADLGGGTLHRRFFALAQADPGAPALRWGGDGEATYGELAERSLRIAGGLAAAGVGEGDRVAIRLPKGPGQVAAVLGVLAAGAAYVPIGVSQPEARAALILEQAGACACIDSPELSRLEAADPLAAPADPPDRALAYVIYTSGSTGVPKGVAVSHAAAWNTIADVVRRWGMGPGDAVLGVSALDFDLSVFDIFGALSFGAAVVLPSEEERRDASAWRDLVSSRGVTVWNSAPALLDVMLDDGPGAADGLRLALVSGDWVPLGLRSKLPEDVRLVAMGGATEAGIWSNYFEVGEVDPSWSSIPYGRPLSNQSFRVVGEDGLDCPDWVPGELWTGGGSLADGYLGDPSKTAASFVEDGGRWYRTGDMGRYWPGAVIEFLGRKDAQQQVKIRGHRVELGEVEAAVAACPGVKGAVAVVAGDRGRSAVHAFAIGDEGCDVNPARVLSRVAELLPSYFVPQDVTILAEWPLSANGKVDRKALADMVPETAPRASSFSEPATETERAVASVWEELLDVRPVGRESNFFELGGDSLMAMKLMSALEKRFGFKLGLQEFLSNPTVAGICQKVDATCADSYEEGTL